MKTRSTTRLPWLNDILAKHRIHPNFHTEFRELIERGVRPGKELRTRLDAVTNYKAALNDAMTELSKPLPHKFGPTTHFESLGSVEFA